MQPRKSGGIFLGMVVMPMLFAMGCATPEIVVDGQCFRDAECQPNCPAEFMCFCNDQLMCEMVPLAPADGDSDTIPADGDQVDPDLDFEFDFEDIEWDEVELDEDVNAAMILDFLALPESPQPQGTVVGLFTNAVAPHAVLYRYKFYNDDTNEVVAEIGFDRGSDVFVVQPPEPGTYIAEAWVKDSQSVNAFDDHVALSYEIFGVTDGDEIDLDDDVIDIDDDIDESSGLCGPLNAPVVWSTTHPIQSDWYTNPDVIIRFSMDECAISGWSLSFDQSPNTVPDNSIDTEANSFSFYAYYPGIYYFKVKGRYTFNGTWSAVGTYRINISATDGDVEIDWVDPDIDDVYDPDPDTSVCRDSCLVLRDCGYLYGGSPFGNNMQECRAICSLEWDNNTLACIMNQSCNTIPDQCFGMVDGDDDTDWIDYDEEPDPVDIDDADNPPLSCGPDDVPVILSSTHPDQNAVYTETVVQMRILIQSCLPVLMGISVSTSPNFIPTYSWRTYTDQQTRIALPTAGTWYVYAAVRSGDGGQSSTAVYRINIRETDICIQACNKLEDCGYIYPSSPLYTSVQSCVDECRSGQWMDGQPSCIIDSTCSTMMQCFILPDGDIYDPDPDFIDPDPVDFDPDVYTCYDACVKLDQCGYLFSGSPAGANMAECVQNCNDGLINQDQINCIAVTTCDNLFDCINPPVDGDIIDTDPEPVDPEPEIDDTPPPLCYYACSLVNDCGYIYPGSPIFTSLQSCYNACDSGAIADDQVDCVLSSNCSTVVNCLFPVDGDVDVIDNDPDIDAVTECQLVCARLDMCHYLYQGGAFGEDSNSCVRSSCPNFDPFLMDCLLNADSCEHVDMICIPPVVDGDVDPIDIPEQPDYDNSELCQVACNNLLDCGYIYEGSPVTGSRYECIDYCINGGMTFEQTQCVITSSCDTMLGCLGIMPDGDTIDPEIDYIEEEPPVCIDMNMAIPFDIDMDSCGFGNDIDFNPPGESCFSWQMGGPDNVFQFNIRGNKTIRVTMETLSPQFDPAVYVVSACGLYQRCLAGADVGYDGEPEEFTWTAPYSGTFLLVVDSYYMSDERSCGPYHMMVDYEVVVDSDNDGIPDSSDNCPLISNPYQENDDGDAWGNVCDNCRYAANDDQQDSDGDTVGDMCDPTPYEADRCAAVSCASDITCSRFGLVCLPLSSDGSQQCSARCENNSDCPDPWLCSNGYCRCGAAQTCPVTCGSVAQCPAGLNYCADVYGSDDIKECTADCATTGLCPDGYDCRNGACICSSLPVDECVQPSCMDDSDCQGSSFPMCLPSPEGRPVCTQFCDASTGDLCPANADCIDGMCSCGTPDPPACWYGSCIINSECPSKYGEGSYCTGDYWPLDQRYCTKDCVSDLDCISTFGRSAVCDNGSCRCSE